MSRGAGMHRHPPPGRGDSVYHGGSGAYGRLRGDAYEISPPVSQCSGERGTNSEKYPIRSATRWIQYEAFAARRSIHRVALSLKSSYDVRWTSN